MPDCEVSFAAGASADNRDYRVDFGKIESQLSAYQPEWTVRRGIEELLDAYTAGGLSIDDWNGDRYYRLRTIKTLLAAGAIDDELRFVRPPAPDGSSRAG